ncbi:MAG TPA: hypothetical protein VFT54_05865 [Acidimicrobiia bacterium]|nr:hypothetical protein [Acidimicrobiia bacterium]
MRDRSQFPNRHTVLREMLRPDERAIESVVGRYQKVAPAVTRFARTLAGNDKLRVVLGPESAASADEIVCDPRLFQAAANRAAPVTADEMALASALHEVVHLVSTDLEKDEPDLLARLEKDGGPVGEILFFSLEDARQERQGLARYAGARSVLADVYLAALPAALSQAGAIGQFTLGCFLLTGDYCERSNLERRVDPRAQRALSEASTLCAAAAVATTNSQVTDLALELLEIARRHGLLTKLSSGATQAQERAVERADAAEAADGVDLVRLPSPSVKDAESYQDTRRAAQARAGLSDRKGASELAGDASTDQLLRVSQAPTVYLPTGMAGKLVVGPAPAKFATFAPDGMAAMATAARKWGITQRQVSGELYPLFAANQRRGLRSGYDQGDVSPHAALFIGAGLYQRMYERRASRTRRSYAVSLLVDASASMLQPRANGSMRTSWGMAAALLGAVTLARLCDELQVDFEVALFNRGFATRPDDTEWSYTRAGSQTAAGLRQSHGTAADRLTTTINHYLVKPFDRRWREAEDVLAGMFWTAQEPAQAALAARRDPKKSPPVSMFERAANVDEFNLIHAAERMGRLGANVRVLVVLADGMTRGSVDALAASVEAVERSGTTVLGIGIGDDTVTDAYHRFEVVNRPEDLTRAMIDGTRNALRRGLALWGMDTWWLRPARQVGIQLDYGKELVGV